MSDSNRDIEVNSLLEARSHIKLLEKALQRERNAKKKLEEKLDQQAQVSFEKNQEMIDAYRKSNLQQIQLQFLSYLTKDMLADHSIDEMFSDFISNLSRMLENCNALQITLSGSNTPEIQIKNTNTAKWRKVPWQESLSLSIKALLIESKEQNHLWHRIEHLENKQFTSLSALLKHPTLLCLQIAIGQDQQRLIILDISHYCYHKEFKQTLHIAGQQFASAIQRRYAEIELSYNYQTLKSTLSELKSTQNQLIHNEKMSSLGQLAAGVAHEINNPIGYINSNLETLKAYIDLFQQTITTYSADSRKKYEIDTNQLDFALSDVRPLIDSCLNGIARVSEIVDSLKMFSRKDNTEFININLNEVIESSLKVVWNQFKYKYKIEQQLSEKLPVVQGSFGQLQQVFINLFVNAAQAMTDNGTLTITSRASDDEIEVAIKDTGCGMDEAALRQLFEPFYTTKDESQGTGLGLSVSYAIIEKHNALISVNSEPQAGTTFTLRFPLIHH